MNVISKGQQYFISRRRGYLIQNKTKKREKNEYALLLTNLSVNERGARVLQQKVLSSTVAAELLREAVCVARYVVMCVCRLVRLKHPQLTEFVRKYTT